MTGAGCRRPSWIGTSPSGVPEPTPSSAGVSSCGPRRRGSGGLDGLRSDTRLPHIRLSAHGNRRTATVIRNGHPMVGRYVRWLPNSPAQFARPRQAHLSSSRHPATVPVRVFPAECEDAVLALSVERLGNGGHTRSDPTRRRRANSPGPGSPWTPVRALPGPPVSSVRRSGRRRAGPGRSRRADPAHTCRFLLPDVAPVAVRVVAH